jgi:hypothetical protein
LRVFMRIRVSKPVTALDSAERRIAREKGLP